MKEMFALFGLIVEIPLAILFRAFVAGELWVWFVTPSFAIERHTSRSSTA